MGERGKLRATVLELQILLRIDDERPFMPPCRPMLGGETGENACEPRVGVGASGLRAVLAAIANVEERLGPEVWCTADDARAP